MVHLCICPQLDVLGVCGSFFCCLGSYTSGFPLMDVRSDVSLRQMCNEPCFVSVTFGMMDCSGRPFNRRRIPFNNMQLGGFHTLKTRPGMKARLTTRIPVSAAQTSISRQS